jgi:transmembrane sensor
VTQLRIPVKRELRDAVTTQSIARVWGRLEARGRAPARSTGRWWFAIGFATAALAALVIAWPTRTAPRPVALADGSSWQAVHAAAPLQLDLDDGSTLGLAPGAALEPLVDTPSDVVVRQLDGHISYDIAPHRHHWTIQCGPVAVEVVGTSFLVDRDAHRVRIDVFRGVVLVHAPGVPDARLTTGMHVDVSTDLASAAPAAVPPGSPAVPAAPAAEGPSPARDNTRDHSAHASLPAAPPPAGETWRELVARGAPAADAYAQLGTGGVAAAARTATVDELYALADVARLSSHAAEAIDPLERIVNAHAGDPRAPLAALTLGRIQLRELGEPARAVRSLERALALGIPADLAEDATALRIEALARAGAREAARTAYAQFVARFPTSPRVHELDRWLAEP